MHCCIHLQAHGTGRVGIPWQRRHVLTKSNNYYQKQQSVAGPVQGLTGFKPGADLDGGGWGEPVPDDGCPEEPHRAAAAAAGPGRRTGGHAGRGRAGCSAAGNPQLIMLVQTYPFLPSLP